MHLSRRHEGVIPRCSPQHKRRGLRRRAASADGNASTREQDELQVLHGGGRHHYSIIQRMGSPCPGIVQADPQVRGTKGQIEGLTPEDGWSKPPSPQQMNTQHTWVVGVEEVPQGWKELAVLKPRVFLEVSVSWSLL